MKIKVMIWYLENLDKYLKRVEHTTFVRLAVKEVLKLLNYLPQEISVDEYLKGNKNDIR